MPTLWHYGNLYFHHSKNVSLKITQNNKGSDGSVQVSPCSPNALFPEEVFWLYKTKIYTIIPTTASDFSRSSLDTSVWTLTDPCSSKAVTVQVGQTHSSSSCQIFRGLVFKGKLLGKVSLARQPRYKGAQRRKELLHGGSTAEEKELCGDRTPEGSKGDCAPCHSHWGCSRRWGLWGQWHSLPCFLYQFAFNTMFSCSA